MKKRGQVGIEFVITVGFALLILIPLSVLLYEHTAKTYEDVNNNQAGLIVRKVVDNANSVYYLGHPSTVTLKVYMPEDIEVVNITGREITFRLDNGGDVVGIANVNLTGSLSAESGLKYIKIAAMENYVNITEDVE